MTWKQVEEEWETLVGYAKSRWAWLTGEDLKTVDATRDLCIEVVKEHHGLVPDDAHNPAYDSTATVVPPPVP